MLRSVLPVLLFFSALSCLAQTPKLDTSIRRTNWDSLLAHDRKHFNFDKEVTKQVERDRRSLGNFAAAPKLYRFKQCDDYDEGPGQLDSALYCDINADGKEDAALELGTCVGGNAGCGSCIVFLQSQKGPKYYGCVAAGDKFHVTTLNGALVTMKWNNVDDYIAEEIQIRNKKVRSYAK